MSTSLPSAQHCGTTKARHPSVFPFAVHSPHRPTSSPGNVLRCRNLKFYFKCTQMRVALVTLRPNANAFSRCRLHYRIPQKTVRVRYTQSLYPLLFLPYVRFVRKYRGERGVLGSYYVLTGTVGASQIGTRRTGLRYVGDG